jgi:NhaA family Na+:H+ antiporter
MRSWRFSSSAEIKRELVVGDLRDPAAALRDRGLGRHGRAGAGVLAELGGDGRGWSASDGDRHASAVGVLTCPSACRRRCAILLTLAIVDDVGAIS